MVTHWVIRRIMRWSTRWEARKKKTKDNKETTHYVKRKLTD